MSFPGSALDPRFGAPISPNATVAPTAAVAPGCFVGAGAVIDEGATLSMNAVVEAGARISTGATVGPGAYIGPGARLAEGASVGPNAVVIADVTVGVHANVGAGAVVEADVPPYARAEGVPAQIVGYRASIEHEAKTRLRASEVDPAAFPLTFGRVTVYRQPVVADLRGSLTFDELGANLPFTPVRYFSVFGVPSREVRGEHAHKELHELLICTHGDCTVMVNDGTERAEIVLDGPEFMLHLPSMVWTAQYRYSPDAVLFVLCSHVYEADDYIRSYDEFLSLLSDD